MTEKEWLEKSKWPQVGDGNFPRVGDSVLICQKDGWGDSTKLVCLGEFQIVSETPTRFKVGPESWVFEKSGGRAFGSNKGLGWKSKLALCFDGWESALENYNENTSVRNMIYKLVAGAETKTLIDTLEILQESKRCGENQE